MIIVGIDPGLGGGIGVLNERAELKCAFPMPVMARNEDKDEVDAANLVRLLEGLGTVIHMVVLERQRPMPSFGFGDKCPVCKRGKTVQSPQTGFGVADGQGIVKGAVAALHLPLSYAEPQIWKRYYGLKGGREHKHLSRSKAIGLYPTAPLTRAKDEGVAEALLIAHWYVMKELIRPRM